MYFYALFMLFMCFMYLNLFLMLISRIYYI